jgi:hypothetical protein
MQRGSDHQNSQNFGGTIGSQQSVDSGVEVIELAVSRTGS